MAVQEKNDSVHPLSQEDYTILRELRKAGVLEDIKPSLIDATRIVMLACGDGHRLHDLYAHARGLCGGEQCLHPILLNGGALVIPVESQLSDGMLDGKHVDIGATALLQISASCQIKHTRKIVCFAHFPCGAAYAHGLDAVRVLGFQVLAKKRIREKLKDLGPLDVSCYVHIDYVGYPEERERDKRFRTYKLNRSAFLLWGQKKGFSEYSDLEKMIAEAA